MSEADRFPTDLEESVEELRRYLADGIPPLLAADAVSTLIRWAPETITAQMQGWLSFQHQARQGTVTAADLAFHALRKLYLLGELGLVPKDGLASYLAVLEEALALLCPPEEREQVRGSVERLRRAPHESVDSLFRVDGGRAPRAAGQAGASGSPGSPGSPRAAEELRRFALLLSRLKAQAGAGAAAPAEELVASLFAAAAASAGDAAEMGTYLEHLRESGVAATDPAAVVRALSRALPAWAPAPDSAAPDALGANARALRRFVDLAEAPQQRLDRFRELVAAVAEAFNAGSLPRAVALVQVAEGLLAEKKVPIGEADLVRGRAHESLDSERLRTLAVVPHQQPLLHQLMGFFPGLRPDGLLADLEDQPDRARRRLLLTLLELHGGAARPALLDRLELGLADNRDTAWFWQRNLCYLLHRLPCPPDALEERELEAVVQFSELRYHPRVVGEAVIRLGQIEHPRAAEALRARLAEVDAEIAAGGDAAPPSEDLVRLRALIVNQMMRSGSPGARRAVVEAELRRLRETGDPGPLAALRGVDLAGEPDLVDELLRSLHERLPRKVLGVTLHRNSEVAGHIVEVLAATRTPAVRRALEDLVERFPREPFGLAAARALAGFGGPRPTGPAPGGPAAAPPAPAAQSMEGDLRLFGLPNLLQSLAQSELTGTLTLRDGNGAPVAVLELAGGGLSDCTTGRLRGDTAFYQLLERTTASSFQFVGREAAARRADGGGAPRSMLGLLMEAMRRYDEYQRARAVVPDATVLVPTGRRPTSLPDETDGGFVRDLWSRVKTGADAAGCEESLAVDAYRVRALLAHWLAEGALAVSPPAA